MEVNIFDKIYKIMTTYENLLKQKKDIYSNNSFDMQNDQFFQFIFQNINLSKFSSTFHSSQHQQQNEKNSEQNEQSLYNQLNQNIKPNTSFDTSSDTLNNTKNNLEKDTKKEENNQNNKQNILSLLHTYKPFSSDKTKGIENPIKNKNTMNSELKKYMKTCYKKIVLLCHPDKTKNNKELYQEYFIKSQEYYENNFVIGLLYLFYILKLKPPSLSSFIINHIIIEIRYIQEKINELIK